MTHATAAARWARRLLQCRTRRATWGQIPLSPFSFSLQPQPPRRQQPQRGGAAPSAPRQRARCGARCARAAGGPPDVWPRLPRLRSPRTTSAVGIAEVSRHAGASPSFPLLVRGFAHCAPSDFGLLDALPPLLQPPAAPVRRAEAAQRRRQDEVGLKASPVSWGSVRWPFVGVCFPRGAARPGATARRKKERRSPPTEWGAVRVCCRCRRNPWVFARAAHPPHGRRSVRHRGHGPRQGCHWDRRQQRPRRGFPQLLECQIQTYQM